MHQGTPSLLITLGALLLAGMVMDVVARRLGVPRVTLLILAGMAAGPSGLDLLPADADAWYPTVSSMALLMVGFLLGRKLALPVLRAHGREVLWFSVWEVLGAAALVVVALVVAGVPLPLALVLGGVAPASAPAAIHNVVDEAGGRGPYTETLLGVVAVDDAWGLIVFSVLLAAAEALLGSGSVVEPLLFGGAELGGALLLGVALGVPAAYVTRWIRSGEPMQAEALGLVLVCGGLALWAGVSYLLAAMVLGTVLANLLHHDSRPFHAIENVEWPIMVVFFILAGAEAHLGELKAVGWLGGVYVVARAAGLMAGAWAGGSLARAPRAHRLWMGPGIMPQAGVALGMALVAGSHLPQWKDTIMAVVVGSTVLFELAGPVLTRTALKRVGEAAR